MLDDTTVAHIYEGATGFYFLFFTHPPYSSTPLRIRIPGIRSSDYLRVLLCFEAFLQHTTERPDDYHAYGAISLHGNEEIYRSIILYI